MTATVTTPEANPEALTELSGIECRELLERHSLGRLAYTDSQGRPVIVPVTYVWDDGEIVIATTAGSKLNAAPHSWVAFEIDGVHPRGAWGWSVSAHGYAFEITSALDDHSAAKRAMAIYPVASGARTHVLSVHVRTMTGRFFGTVPDSEYQPGAVSPE